MNDPIHIEPGPDRRAHFALWCLSQDPPVQTASASGFDVPLDLYPSVPAELLEGARVDGFPYGRPTPQPESQQAAEAPVAPLGGAAQPESQQAAEAPIRKARKAAARKTSATAPGNRIDDPSSILLVDDFGGTGA